MGWQWVECSAREALQSSNGCCKLGLGDGCRASEWVVGRGSESWALTVLSVVGSLAPA